MPLSTSLLSNAGCQGVEEPMYEGTDRRAPETARVPFESLVEVGSAMGPAFEAHSIDLSCEGMHMRTAYLPEVGQQLTCRFETGPNATVLASGEVVWVHGDGRSGNFGMRFTDLDPESMDALRAFVSPPAGEQSPAAPPMTDRGSRVRLHIEGLGSPMRARVRESRTGGVVVGSDLGFLQVGKDLEIEEAGTGQRRSAFIDRVDIDIDTETRVPQLVVELKYARATTDDVAGAAVPQSVRPSSAPPAKADAIDDADPDVFKGTVARKATAAGQAMSQMATRAKNAFELFLQNRHKKDETAHRRTTSPAPGGGLHASGRKVVRGEAGEDELPIAGPTVNKRKLAIGGAVGVAVLLGFMAMRKPTTNASLPAPEVPVTPAQPTATDPNAVAANPPPNPALSPSNPSAGMAFANPPGVNVQPAVPSNEPSMEPSVPAVPRHVAPFGNGPVAHGNILRLKMDGPIERINGAPQPTGFTVRLPNRKSLEAASPLASRDGRIASIRVTNEPGGAELSLAFKDGVPNYQVRARGDVLEIALAPIGNIKPRAQPAKHTPTKHKKHKTH
jgi:hypothetical protein